MGNREGNILKQIYPPFSPLVPIPLAHNSSFLPITRLPTFFPSKTPQGTLDEAVVGRKNGTCTFFRSSPLDARPSDHRIASFTIFFSPPPQTAIPYLCSTAFYAPPRTVPRLILRDHPPYNPPFLRHPPSVHEMFSSANISARMNRKKRIHDFLRNYSCN